VCKSSFKKGDVIFHENQAGEAMFIIEKGIVEVTSVSFRGDKKMFAILGPGECFGEMSIFSLLPRTAQTRAMTNCSVYIIYRKDLIPILKNNPEISLAALKIVCRRLAAADMEIKSLSFEKVDERIAETLLTLCEKIGHPDNRGIEFEIRVTHQLIAELVGSQREVVSRQMKKFSDYGWIKTSSKGIVILNLGAIKTFLNERI